VQYQPQRVASSLGQSDAEVLDVTERDLLAELAERYAQQVRGYYMSQSIAFKCTYNDGGEGVFVGFADTCSKENIERNVRNKRVWCSSPLCECSKFYSKSMKGAMPVEPCYESRLFREWSFGAGGFHTGLKAGDIHLTKSAPGKFAILTTRFPGDTEADRRIIGLFKIAQIENQNTVLATPAGRIRLPLEEATELFFWAYLSNSNNDPDWRTGLFRYLEDGQVHRILEDVAATVRDEKTKAAIDTLINDSFGSVPAPPPSGCLAGKSTGRRAAMARLRKYGPGGEGKDHYELKTWIQRHPEVIGLTDVSDVAVEHPFISGDAVDLVFAHKSGAYTVVEIETTTPLPGAHQAIKYRALLCAEKGLPLDSSKVRSKIVAWSIPSDVEQFCSTYGIEFHHYGKPVDLSRRNKSAN
jgi:hypothetical protein